MAYPLVKGETSSVASYGFARIAPISELQTATVQGFSDDTGPTELRDDITYIHRAVESTILNMKQLVESLLRALWRSIKPKEIVSLKPGEIRKISDDLIVEKTADGKIIVYEVID